MSVTRLGPDLWPAGRADVFQLDSATGLRAVVSGHGARLKSLVFPDGTDVAMATAEPPARPGQDRYAGAICGRYANRIAGARFRIGGREYRLAANEGDTQLHGGPDGFSDRIWEAQAGNDGVRFSLISPDGDQGFPGRLSVTADYSLAGRRLDLTITATTSAPSPVNLTQHVYWNLAGAGDLADHALGITAAQVTPVDARQLPTGAILSVTDSPFDFREPRSLGEALRQRPEGFDHNFCLDGPRGMLRAVARLDHRPSRRSMTLWTSEAGLQLYTAQHFGPGVVTSTDRAVIRQGAVALEPQCWPDAPNHPDFPPCLLEPGATYEHRIAWVFDWR